MKFLFAGMKKFDLKLSFYKKFLGLVLVTSSAWISSSWGCASCGSGGDDPMILFPNESIKFYLGYTATRVLGNYTDSGKHVHDPLPKFKESFLFSFGESLSQRFFYTLSLPLLRNHNGSRSISEWGDPAFGVRYTLVLPFFDETNIPQIQIIAGHKIARAKSIKETKDFQALDVFGTGFHETKFGIDIWYGLNEFKYGISQMLYFPHPRRFMVQGPAYKPGLGFRTTLTLGHSLLPQSKILGGVIYDLRLKDKRNNEFIEGSSLSSLGFFTTIDFRTDENQTWRATLSYSGANLIPQKNTLHSLSLTFGYMHAW